MERVRLADVLKAAGVKGGVVYTAHEGADTHPSGAADRHPISRGVPIVKAMDQNTLPAFTQHGRPIHPTNDAPLRLVFPGWPGACSQKWRTRVWLRDRVHDGAKMTGTSYRVPGRPIAPEEPLDEKDFVIIQAMPVKSLITYPATGHRMAARTLGVRGHAWLGDSTVDAVRLSIDFGATWSGATLDAPVNPGAWQNWRDGRVSRARLLRDLARATDSKGIIQPHAVAWNSNGYLNNAMHRVAVTVARGFCRRAARRRRPKCCTSGAPHRQHRAAQAGICSQ